MDRDQRGCRWVRSLAVGLAGGVALSACSYIPGTEESTPEFSHDFRPTDSDGEPIDSSSLVFAWDDLNGYWEPIDDSSAVTKFSGNKLIPRLVIDTEEVELDSDGRLCLVKPIVFMSADNFAVVHEIPAGSCIENDGRTDFVVSNDP